MKLVLVGTLLLVLPTVGSAQTYNCEVDAPRVVAFDGDKASAQTMNGLPKEALQFQLNVSNKNARVVWENSPIQMSGENQIFPTGNGSGLVIFLSGGPCLLTDGACGSMLNFSKQADGGLDILISPTALVTDSETKKTTPFFVAILGKCGLRKIIK